jgi:hypothetical protein
MSTEPVQKYQVVTGELGFYLPPQEEASVCCVAIDPETEQQFRLYLKVDRQTMWTAYFALKKQAESLIPPTPAA